MPGVASRQSDRPQRVRWLAVLAAAWVLLLAISGSHAQDLPSRLGDEEDSRLSRDLLTNPEAATLDLDDINSPDEEISGDEFLNEPIVEVLIEGRETIQEHAILSYLKVKKGRVVTPREVQEDVLALRKTHWFSSVRPIYRRTSQGLVLVYEIRERPIIRDVKFIGNKKIRTSELEAHTGLRINQPFDTAINKEAVARIRSLYKEKGFRYAAVELSKGGHPDDREVVITISEGNKTRVRWTSFEGNAFASDAILRTKLASKRGIGWVSKGIAFGGVYDPEIVENDVITLTQYYNNLGYFDAQVTHREEFTEGQMGVNVIFTVNEGMRYKVRNVDLVGYEVLSRDKLHHRPKLKAGDYFNYRFMQLDVNEMKDQYDRLGRLFAEVKPTPIFLDEPGVIDLEYRINEDKPYLVGDIKVNFRGDMPHTREDVILNNVARLIKPGQLADGSKIDLARRRVVSSQLWDQSDPPSFEITPVDGRDYMLAADDPLSDIMRGQDRSWPFVRDPLSHPDSQSRVGFGHSVAQNRRTAARPAAQEPTRETAAIPMVNRISAPAPAAVRGQNIAAPRPMPRGVSLSMPNRLLPTPSLSERARAKSRGTTSTSKYNMDPGSLFGEPIEADIVLNAPDEADGPAPADPEFVVRAQNEFVPRGQSIDRNGTPIPQDFRTGSGNSGNPYGGTNFGRNVPPPPGYVDLNIDVTEGRTGRLMAGAGVNSNNGLVGSVVLQEDNFDIMRPPRSWADIVNGYAWRGAGQSFRIEAQPGTQVSRYVVSWNDPFFMRTDYNVGVSGFYFNRFYTEWTEDRLGGRLSVGKAINQYWSASAALRLEDVNIHSVPTTAPQDLKDVQGHNFLSTGSITISNDTRDNSFIPTQGHYLEGSVEQAFGDFTYTRLEATGSQFFTLRERADGFGKHILQLYGQVNWTGNDTPIFERYFAGGYSSFRGYAFRGVSPHEGNFKVGGNFMALGTVEYMLPITANDQIRTVFFTDFGSVDRNVTFKDIRVSAGFGFRLIIPAMGPAPIAFDFAWPVVDQYDKHHATQDNRRVFSFYVGFTR